MKLTLEKVNGHTIAVVDSKKAIITDESSAFEFIINAQFEADSNRIAVNSKAFSDEFYDLDTGLTQSILQKFINYKIKLAIYGNLSVYDSEKLSNYITELNRDDQIFFVSDKETALAKLS